jgi:hypothetical protein
LFRESFAILKHLNVNLKQYGGCRWNIILNYHVTLLLILLLFACQAQTTLTGHLPIHIPDGTMTGSTITVTVGPVQALDGTNIGLVIVGKHGPRIYRGTFESGFAEFIIPEEDTRQPWYFAVIAAAGDARGETSMILRSDHNSPNPQDIKDIETFRHI